LPVQVLGGIDSMSGLRNGKHENNQERLRHSRRTSLQIVLPRGSGLIFALIFLVNSRTGNGKHEKFYHR
jgi:hypothetical protein